MSTGHLLPYSHFWEHIYHGAIARFSQPEVFGIHGHTIVLFGFLTKFSNPRQDVITDAFCFDCRLVQDMEKKLACLEKIIFKRIPFLQDELKMQNTQAQFIWNQIASYLHELNMQNASPPEMQPSTLSSSTENSKFICDQPIAHLCGLGSRFALAVGDYVHQVLSTVNHGAEKLNQSAVSVDRLSVSDMDSETSPASEKSRYVELARLTECKRLTLSLQVNINAENARLVSQITWLKSRLALKGTHLASISQTSHESSNVEMITEVEKLRRHCDQLALELAHLGESEMEQVNIEQSLGRRQAYLQRLDKLVDCAVDENAWNQFFADLITVESDSFDKAIELLRNIQRSAETFLSTSETLVDRLTTARQTTSELELDRFRRAAIVEKFEQALLKVIRGLPLPQGAQEIRDSSPLTTDSIRLILGQIRTGLTDANLSICQTSSHIAKLIPHIQKQFVALEDTFKLSKSGSVGDHQSTQPHVECVQSERLIASGIGLCSSDLLQSMAERASILESLTREIRELKLESDRVFAFVGTTVN